jgi:hypothetical protein
MIHLGDQALEHVQGALFPAGMVAIPATVLIARRSIFSSETASGNYFEAA